MCNCCCSELSPNSSFVYLPERSTRRANQLAVARQHSICHDNSSNKEISFCHFNEMRDSVNRFDEAEKIRLNWKYTREGGKVFSRKKNKYKSKSLVYFIHEVCIFCAFGFIIWFLLKVKLCDSLALRNSNKSNYSHTITTYSMFWLVAAVLSCIHHCDFLSMHRRQQPCNDPCPEPGLGRPHTSQGLHRRCHRPGLCPPRLHPAGLRGRGW